MLGYSGNNQIPGQLSGAGGSQLNAGTGGSIEGLYALLSGAMGDPTKSNIANATAYAQSQSPFIQGEVNNAMLAGTQEARDVTLPAITQGAAATGNINSSRVGGPDGGIAGGLVERGLAEQASNLYSTLEGQAYNTGLGLSENARATNLGALGSAIGLGTNLAGLGAGNLTGSIGAQGGLYDIANSGGSGLQASQQAAIDQILAKYGFNVSAPFAPYQQFGGIVDPVAALGGSGTSSGTQVSTPSIYQIIGGLMSAGGNLAKGIYG